jgi:hypothetical protein
VGVGEERITLRHNEGNAATGGIFRVRGAAGGREPGQPPSGSSSRILKIARPPTDPPATSSAWQTSNAPDHFNYWRREVYAYETGLADSVYRDAGIRAPRLESVVPLPDGRV